MPDPIKTAESSSATPAKARAPRAKKAAKSAASKPAKTRADKPKKSGPAKPGVAPRLKKTVEEKKPPKRAARAPAGRKPEISLEQRRRHVELAAYFMAERHGFTPGREYEDWAAAEAEIDRMLSEGLLLP
jgi:hypothetical protein